MGVKNLKVYNTIYNITEKNGGIEFTPILNLLEIKQIITIIQKQSASDITKEDFNHQKDFKKIWSLDKLLETF